MPIHELIRAWRAAPFHDPPYILPGDESILNWTGSVTVRSLAEVLRHRQFDFAESRAVHLGLLPVPFAGDLTRADVFILLLNPGFRVVDYFSEFRNQKFAEALRGNLKQRVARVKYPMFYLNPEFGDTGGYRYWRGKLGGLITLASESFEWTMQRTLRYLSQRIVALEMFPYHSARFGVPTGALAGMRSVRLIQSFVHDIVVPRAQAGDATVVVTRQARVWGVPRHRNIVIYDGGEVRGAHLTPKSRGGRAIAERLGL